MMNASIRKQQESAAKSLFATFLLLLLVLHAPLITLSKLIEAHGTDVTVGV